MAPVISMDLSCTLKRVKPEFGACCVIVTISHYSPAMRVY
ncbi:hypothetical protein BZL30_9243 [Mycobacterium kansasii]|uniref:Uncharacterized protein n=1 Tax=Mycobacterium kansasii TaxID=1768 RepID=A0A1V3WB23_MYCKA|nr:hypothetical protein BZL30_9243 [Mycobacterium kansasii]